MSRAILLNHGYTKSIVYEVISSPREEWDPSITDPTFYTPVGSLVRKLNSQDKVPMNRNPTFYDFPDGKDTGITLPVSRRPDADLAEISMAIKEGEKQVEKGVKEAQKKKAQKVAEQQAQQQAQQSQQFSDLSSLVE